MSVVDELPGPPGDIRPCWRQSQLDRYGGSPAAGLTDRTRKRTPGGPSKQCLKGSPTHLFEQSFIGLAFLQQVKQAALLRYRIRQRKRRGLCLADNRFKHGSFIRSIRTLSDCHIE
jgi:hypothetical protein